MRVLPLALAMTLVAAPGNAAGDYVVDAGEHGEFSRVVFPSGVAGLQHNREQRYVDIWVGAEAGDVDLNSINVARRAPRAPTATTRNEGGGTVVRLSLACDCEVTHWRNANGRYVIDVKGAVSAEGRAGTGSTASEPAPSKRAEAPSRGELSVEEAQNRMVALLQQAAEDGIITIRRDAAQLEAPAPSAPASAQKANPAESAPVAPRPAPRVVRACLGDSAWALDAAEFEQDPLGSIAKHQTLIAEAPPEKQYETGVKLAQGYLAVGFGEEALSILREIGEEETAHAEMSRVVAERPLSKDGPLLGAEDCAGAHALWQSAALSSAGAVKAARLSGDAVGTLPKRLRTMIASRIARKMVEQEAWGEAERFYAVAKEAAGGETEELAYISARLMAQEGRGEEATGLLEEIAASSSSASQDAVLALAERYAGAATPMPAAMVQDLGGIALTQRGTSAGSEAALLEAAYWAESGDIDAAVMLLQAAARDTSSAEAARLRAIGVLAKAFSSDDPALHVAALRAYLDNRAFLEGARREHAILRREAAEKALDLGVPNVALRLLEEEDAGEVTPQSARLRAGAALQAGRPETVVAIVAPFSTEPGFARLLYQAQMEAGDHHSAIATAASLADDDQRPALTAAAAWRASEWRTAAAAYRRINPLAVTGEQARKFALSAYMAGETVMPAAAEAVLQRELPETHEAVKLLFSSGTSGALDERGRALLSDAGMEVQAIRRIFGNG